MTNIEISKVEIRESGKLLVTPTANWNHFFQFIYRAATGVNWEEKSESFITPAPKEWSYFDWYGNILSSVKSEMGVNLEITPRTKWINIPEELQREIANYKNTTR